MTCWDAPSLNSASLIRRWHTYKMAANLTPASISRLQNLGMMTYYAGDRQEAEKILDRTARLGLDSKMFDCQTLVLLACTRLENGDGKGLQRCRDDFARLIEKDPKNERHQRLSGIVEVLSSIQQGQCAGSRCRPHHGRHDQVTQL